VKPGDYYETSLRNISEVSNVGPESPFPLRVKDNFPQLFELLTVQKNDSRCLNLSHELQFFSYPYFSSIILVEIKLITD
jgi:hypothetical protein